MRHHICIVTMIMPINGLHDQHTYIHIQAASTQ